MVIRGTIKNFDALAAHVLPETYLQLVPILANGGLRVVMQFGDGGLLYATFESDLAKLPVPKEPAFSLEVPGVPPGRYFLAAQRTNLPWSTASEGPVFLADKGALFFIDVPARADSPLSIAAGDLIVRIHP